MNRRIVYLVMVTVLRDGAARESKIGGGFGFKAAGNGASAVQRAARRRRQVLGGRIERGQAKTVVVVVEADRRSSRIKEILNTNEPASHRAHQLREDQI